jgi:site-specific DNA-methyltransferase (adenine-specific)
MNSTLYCGDCIEIMEDMEPVHTIFADPPDNIGLGYKTFNDKQPDEVYKDWLETCLDMFMRKSEVIWFSFNARWTFDVGEIFHRLLKNEEWEGKPCLQVFTFGQHNHHDLGNNHRPLWRLKKRKAPLYCDAIRIPSWRQENGDKRADPRGRVPGDVFDFTRVTGNSKQRRSWHPTQLNEALVERCLRMTTQDCDTVLDPFGGTGTTLRACQTIQRDCILIELDPYYCEQIVKEHGLVRSAYLHRKVWQNDDHRMAETNSRPSEEFPCDLAGSDSQAVEG